METMLAVGLIVFGGIALLIGRTNPVLGAVVFGFSLLICLIPLFPFLMLLASYALMRH